MNKTVQIILKASRDFPKAAEKHRQEKAAKIQKEAKALFLKRMDAALLACLADVSKKIDAEAARLKNGVNGENGLLLKPQTSFSASLPLRSDQASGYIFIKGGAACIAFNQVDTFVPYKKIRALPGFEALLKYGQKLGVSAEIHMKVETGTGLNGNTAQTYNFLGADLRDYLARDTEGRVFAIEIKIDLEKPFNPQHYPSKPPAKKKAAPPTP